MQDSNGFLASKRNLLSMKKDRIKDLFLEQLRKVPIIQVVCEKVGISRSSAYRWIDESQEFRKQVEAAMIEGETFINEMGESQIISLMRQGNWSAISFWARHRNPKFRERIDINANIQTPNEELTSEQQEVVKNALCLASLTVDEGTKEINKKIIREKHD